MKNTLRIKLAIALTLLTVASLTARADVKETWEKTCASCHGKDGKGQTKMGRKVDVKDYTDPKVQADLTDEKATKIIKEGIKDDKGKERMKAYEDFSADEIKALIAYIRAFKTP